MNQNTPPYKASEELANSYFKGFVFRPREAGMTSTERRTLSHVRKALDELEHLNRNNLKDASVFEFCKELIMDTIGRTHTIKAVGNTYSIVRKICK